VRGDAHSAKTCHLSFVAADQVSLKVKQCSTHALLGPNGAGKTTAFNLLTKFLPVTSGGIHFNGQDITREKSAEIARRGVIRSFQISAVFPNLTVMKDVRVASSCARGTLCRVSDLLDEMPKLCALCLRV
jgi:branched-chain amino acid transport system ATP-binding protein